MSMCNHCMAISLKWPVVCFMGIYMGLFQCCPSIICCVQAKNINRQDIFVIVTCTIPAKTVNKLSNVNASMVNASGPPCQSLNCPPHYFSLSPKKHNQTCICNNLHMNQTNTRIQVSSSLSFKLVKWPSLLIFQFFLLSSLPCHNTL